MRSLPETPITLIISATTTVLIAFWASRSTEMVSNGTFIAQLVRPESHVPTSVAFFSTAPSLHIRKLHLQIKNPIYNNC